MVGILPRYSPDPLSFLHRCVGEYGDLVHLRFPSASAYLLGNPGLVEKVLLDRGGKYIKARMTRSMLAVLGNGLLLSEGEYWRRQRRLVQPAFHRERVRGYAEVMVPYTERLLDGWVAGEPRDLHRDMMGLTLEIVAKTLFDEDVREGATGRAVDRALGEIMAYFSGQGVASAILRMLPKWLPAPQNLRYRRAKGRLDAVTHGIIEQRRTRDAGTRDAGTRDADAGEGNNGDLLGMLMDARYEDGEKMSDEQLRDEALTIVLAGHETTAIALSWTFWLLGNHPAARGRLEEELDREIGARSPTPEDLSRLPVLDAVLKESLRLYPPAWAVGREAVEDCELAGYRVPAGTQIFISSWVIQRDGRFFEHPEDFVPERWLDGSTDGLPRYAYFPFGGGPRSCVGAGFARMEAALLLATIAGSWRLEPVAGHAPVPDPSITLRPGGGVQVVPAKRS